jgi:hypothetical protein
MVMKTGCWNWVFCIVVFVHMISNAHSQPAMSSPSVKFLTQFHIVDSTETNTEIVQQNVVLAIQQMFSTLDAAEIVVHPNNVTVH